MAKLYNLARMTTATPGTGTITLGAAVSGYLTFAQAGVANGDVVDYAIKDGANSEHGTGTYTSGTLQLTRTVTNSTNGNAAINLSGLAEVAISPRAQTLAKLDQPNSFTYSTASSGGYQYTCNAGATAVGNSAPLTGLPFWFYSTDGGCAGFSLHRNGTYAVNVSLDPDAWVRIGGWSDGVGVTRWGVSNLGDGRYLKSVGAGPGAVTPVAGIGFDANPSASSVALPSGSPLPGLRAVQDGVQAAVLLQPFGGSPMGGVFRSSLALGSVASPAQVTAGAQMFNLSAQAYNNGATYGGVNARISMFVLNNQTTTDASSYTAIYNTPSGSTTLAEGSRHHGSGGVSVGTTTDPGTGGFLASAGIGAGGVLPIQSGDIRGLSTAKAWLNQGGASGAIIASFNISSVGFTTGGIYSASFTTAMSNANYSFQLTALAGSIAVGAGCLAVGLGSKTTTTVNYRTLDTSFAGANALEVYLAVFGT